MKLVTYFISLTLCLLVALFSPSVKAATYYVKAGGDDANSGTSTEQAWRSINKINSHTFLPGDSILFEGGASFEGSLFFDNSSCGTAAHPIVISSFGSGRAIIKSGSSYGLKAYNTAGFRIERLVFQGAGRTNNNSSGIEFFMDLADSRLPYIRIDSVDVSAYHDSGISIGSWNGASGFDDISITNSEVHENGDAGISTYAEARLGHKNMYVGYTKAYNNSGLPEKTHLHSGNGIVLGGVDGAVIEYCQAYNNGWLNAWKDGGPVGIWGWHCNKLLIQYNESHHNKTGTGKDGGGFDIDGGCTNCSMQYNYSHDNEGPGYLIAQYYHAPAMDGLVVRYNISENDARKNGYGAIHLWSSGASGGIQNAEIYNNTIFLTPAPHGTPRGIYVQSGGVKNVRIRNNIILTSGGLELVYVDKLTDLRFEGNNYWSGGSNFKINWGGTNYSSLESWRAGTGQEQLNAQPLGSFLDPQLIDPGKGVTFEMPGMLYTLEGYQLKASSPVADKGLYLPDYGLDAGQRDFWGNNLERRKAFSIGAHQLTDNSNACLYGGLLPLTFGQAAGGVYSGRGVEEGMYFNPALSGRGKHGIVYAYTDSAGKEQGEHHTFTVVEETLTEWKGQNAASESWFDSRNWSTCLPAAAVDAYLPLPAAGEAPLLPKIKEGELAFVRNLTLAGQLTIENEGSLEINGLLSGEGLAADTRSVLVFKSDTVQHIPAASFGTLLLKGTGAKVLKGNIFVNEQLLSEGKLFLGNYGLTLGKQAEIINSSATAYIVTDSSGSLSRQGVGEGKKVVFPIGTATSYTPAAIENYGVPDDFSVRVEEGVWETASKDSPAKQAMVNRTWQVEEKKAGGSDVSLSLQWKEEDEMADFNRQESFVTHFEQGVWSKPTEEEPAGPASYSAAEASYTKTMKRITSFSPFSVGSEASSLPVSFRFFKLLAEEEEVLLQWETGIEKNNSGFDVEVSEDGLQYSTLGFVASKGPYSLQPQQYNFRDSRKGKSGILYYRLKQIDTDGSSSYSPVKQIFLEGGKLAVYAYPNPFAHKIHLEVYSVGEGILALHISDGHGRQLLKKQVDLQHGVNRHILALGAEFPSGLYLLSAYSHGAGWQLKILKE